MTAKRSILMIALAAAGSLACSNRFDRAAPRVSHTTITSANRVVKADHTAADRLPVLPPERGPGMVEAENHPPAIQTTREWENRYPFAATELMKWARRHPDAAAALAAWEKTDPEKPSVLIQWATGHPLESLGGFLMNRPGWGDLADLDARDPAAMQELLEWSRRSPRAADELVRNSTGFSTFDDRAGKPTTRR